MADISFRGSRSHQFASTLDSATIPEKLRCWICDRLSLAAVKWECCWEFICYECSLVDPVGPHCQRCGLVRGSITVARQLRTTTRVYLKTLAKQRELNSHMSLDEPIVIVAENKPPTSSRTHLLGLPQELQDSIYGYAYPKATSTMLDRERWWDLEEYLETLSLPFPSLAIDERKNPILDMMVSKKYFADATKVWASNQDFLLHKTGALYCTPTPMRDTSLNVFQQHATNIRIVILRHPIVVWPCSVKHLEVGMQPDLLFNIVEDKHPCSDTFDLHDLSKLMSGLGFGTLKGLKEIKLLPRMPNSDFTSPKAIKTFTENVKALEDYIRPMVKCSKMTGAYALASFDLPTDDDVEHLQ